MPLLRKCKSGIYLCGEINNKYNLNNQNEWHSKFEIPVFCFMAEYVHSQCGSKTSTNDCQQK